jgi:predicted metal-binding transcription factor (methanogenesis marker protein 9)
MIVEDLVKEMDKRRVLEVAVFAAIMKHYELVPNTTNYVRRKELQETVAAELGMGWSTQISTIVWKCLRPKLVRDVALSGVHVYKGLKKREHG